MAREGIVANQKRIESIAKRASKSPSPPEVAHPRRADPLGVPSGPGERLVDGLYDRHLADGRSFRTLNIVDDFARERVAIEVDRSFRGARVVRVLERLAETAGLPMVLVSANGPEFAGRTLDAWA